MRIVLFLNNSISCNEGAVGFIHNWHNNIKGVIIVSQVKKPAQLLRYLSGRVSLVFLLYKLLESRGGTRIYKICKAYGIPVLEVRDINSPPVLGMIKGIQPDYCFCYVQQILGKELLAASRFINGHGSLLPAYKGAAQYFWYNYYREKEGGCTIHYMTEKLDNGRILGQKRFDIPAGMDMFSIHLKIGSVCFELFDRFLKREKLPVYGQRDNHIYLSLPTGKDMERYRSLGYKIAKPGDFLKRL